MKTIIRAKNTFVLSIIFFFIAFVNVYAQGNGHWEILNEGGNFNTINFVNDQVGWIAGNGTLSKTEDGGQSWTSLQLNEKLNIRMIDFINENVGWIVGDNTLLKSENGGQTWNSVLINENLDIYGIDFVNDSIGWCIGSCWNFLDDINEYIVIKSVDGGHSWLQQNGGSYWISSDYRFSSLWFINPDVGIITGSDSDDEGRIEIVSRTFDGGNSWEDIAISELSEIDNFQFIDDSTIYFTAKNEDGNIILCETTDTLKSWIRKTVSAYPIYSYYIHGDNIVCFSVVGDTVMKSMDGGITWEKKQTIWNGGWLTYFINENVGFILRSESFYKTIDGGESWILQKFSCPFSDIYFIDKNLGFVCGGGVGRNPHPGMCNTWGDIYITHNGGKTWTHHGGLTWFKSYLFLNDNMGFALDVCGELYKTDDQGYTWDTIGFENNQDSSEFSFTSTDFHFINEQTGWTVGSWSIFESDSSGAGIMNTFDGGENWNLVWKFPDTERYPYVLNSLCFVNSSAWAVGESGLIVKQDGPDQWKAITHVTDLPLNKVFFSDENHGWISGGYFNDNDMQFILLKTMDGGVTWSEKQDLTYQINDMYFADSLHGWAVGNDTTSSGIILATRDGGDIWNIQINNLSAPINALHFKDGYGWAAGESGLVLRTEDGSTWIDNNNRKTYPSKFSLSQNYPNPFNPKTIINYELPNTNEVELSIYNLLGQKVVTLVSEKQTAGHHHVEWDASGIASGVYYYKIEVGDPARRIADYSEVKKMVLLK